MLLPTQIDHSASKSFLGFIVASFSFGQLVTSPLIGMWSNYRPIKEPLIITLLISTGGYLMYAYAGAFEHAGKWVLITSRFIMGLAAGKYVYCSTLYTVHFPLCTIVNSLVPIYLKRPPTCSGHL